MDHLVEKLGKRGEGFKLIWNSLEEMKSANYLIIETGTTRVPDNWEGDGQSTRIWDLFLQTHNGKCYSVDIDPEACDVAKGLVSDKCEVICADSLLWLDAFPRKAEIDFLYLDSMDIDWYSPMKSALHHIYELSTCLSCLKKGCLVAVDDNMKDSGKGWWVRDVLLKLGWKMLYNQYQIVFQKPF